MTDSEIAGFAYTVATGRLFVPIDVFHREAERLLAQPLLTHEFGEPEVWADLRGAMEAELTIAFERRGQVDIRPGIED